MKIKQQFGQFFTTNTDYILAGFADFVRGKRVTDPFAGQADLLHWAQKNGAETVRGYDIDNDLIDNQLVFFNDSLRAPLEYDFVLTNPPCLYQNKMDDNSILNASKHTDLYQLALEKIMNSKEGIVIVPINFLSAENSKYIRQMFLEKFDILKVNYFTHQVFSDTTYNVIAFYYRRQKCNRNMLSFELNIYPEQTTKEILIYKQHDWQIGGDFLSKIKEYSNRLNITRLEEEDLANGDIQVKLAYNHLNKMRNFSVDKTTYQILKNNIILLKAIDTGTDEGKICLEDIRKYGCDGLVSIKTSRNQINLIFPSTISVSEQEQLIELFNIELEAKRREYDSLFMTNYRDKGRKRISFNFAYNFINYLYFNKLRGVDNGVKYKPALF